MLNANLFGELQGGGCALRARRHVPEQLAIRLDSKMFAAPDDAIASKRHNPNGYLEQVLYRRDRERTDERTTSQLPLAIPRLKHAHEKAESTEEIAS